MNIIQYNSFSHTIQGLTRGIMQLHLIMQSVDFPAKHTTVLSSPGIHIDYTTQICIIDEYIHLILCGGYAFVQL